MSMINSLFIPFTINLISTYIYVIYQLGGPYGEKTVSEVLKILPEAVGQTLLIDPGGGLIEISTNLFFGAECISWKKKMILYIMTEGGPVSKIFGPSHQVKCSSDTWEKKVNRGKLKWLLVWILWELYIVGLYFYLKNCFFQYHDVPRRACVQFHLGNQLGN